MQDTPENRERFERALEVLHPVTEVIQRELNTPDLPMRERFHVVLDALGMALSATLAAVPPEDHEWMTQWCVTALPDIPRVAAKMAARPEASDELPPRRPVH